MSGYLSKEEIKQWRSSLEKITLEEFALRLGKTLKEEKQTRDIVDMVLKNESNVTKVSPTVDSKKTKVLKAAQMPVEKQIQMSSKAPKLQNFAEFNLKFKKPLTPREQTVLSVFLENSGHIVYAKDLAQILELPTDYVYKYIKNLRAKISNDVLQNADRGGYVINV